MIYMHAYSFRGYPLETALRKSIQYGYEGIELDCSHLEGHPDVRGVMPKAFETAAKYNVPIPVVDVSAETAGDDAAKRKEEIKRVIEIAEMAKSYGAKILNGSAASLSGENIMDFDANGSAIATEAHYERAAEAFQEIGAKLVELGLIFTFELHMNTIHDTAKSAAKLLDMIGSPAVKANVDPGNMAGIKRAEDVVETAKILGKRIGFWHMKNCQWIDGKPNWSCTLSNGQVNLSKGVEAAIQEGFVGPFCIEYCGEGDPEPAVKEDISYLRNILADQLR